MSHLLSRVAGKKDYTKTMISSYPVSDIGSMNSLFQITMMVVSAKGSKDNISNSNTYCKIECQGIIPITHCIESCIEEII